MNDMTAYTIDTGFWSERYRPEPPPPIGKPPCEGCEHIARCARESLACCAFAAYISGRRAGHRRTHREPSSEWHYHAEHLGQNGNPAPHCEQCNTPRKPPSRTRATYIPPKGTTRVRIFEVVAPTTGLTKGEISAKLNITEYSVDGAVRRMHERGILEIAGTAPSCNGVPHNRWRVNRATANRIIALLTKQPGMLAKDMADALDIPLKNMHEWLEMLHAFGLIARMKKHRGLRVWGLRDG